MEQKNHYKVLLPAIGIALIALMVNIVKFKPLNPKIIVPDEVDDDAPALIIPITPGDPVLGSRKAPKTLIAFEDFGCAHCKDQSAIFDRLLERHDGKFNVVFKGLPVTRFPYNSRDSIKYGFCLNQQQKFKEYKDLAFSNSTNLSKAVLDEIVKNIEGVNKKKLDECLASGTPESQIQLTEALASSLYIQAVPAVFYEGKQVTLPDSEAGWEDLLGLTN